MQMKLINESSYKIKNLFSTHYFENYLKINPIFKEKNFDKNMHTSFDSLKISYIKLKQSHPELLNEAQLREDFISHILKELGFIYDVETPILDSFGVYGRPDYSLFSTEEEKIIARNTKNKNSIDFFNHVIGIVEAKEWKIDLDKAKTGKSGNPSLQISNYLLNSKVKWGILTNGRLWRLYYYETCSRLDSYFEINLEDIFDTNNIVDYKWFYFLFRKESFIQKDGYCLLDEIYNENLKKSKELEIDVKENIYRALKTLAKGFYVYPDNNLTINDIDEVYNNCLILLYRLLFILYAESSERNFLPVHNQTYYEISLGKKIQELVKKDPDSFLPTKDDYWAHLKFLFTVINFGSENRKIPKEKLYIPPYNGGLFNPIKHKFLEEKKIGDLYIAETIDLLARSSEKNNSDKVFIDYSTLEIRQLGSIYEGILEYKIKMAQEPMVLITDKNKEKWIPQSEYKGNITIEKIDPSRKVDTNDLYLVADKEERKITGSYYLYNVKFQIDSGEIK